MRKKEFGVGHFVEMLLQCIALSLCFLILCNMALEDAQPPKPTCYEAK